MRDRAAAGCLRLQDGINNDALLIDDCNGNPAPHHWCAPYGPAPSSLQSGPLTVAPHAGSVTATVTTAPTPTTADSTVRPASAGRSRPTRPALRVLSPGRRSLRRAVNCNIFLCDDSDCGDSCRVVEGRDQVEVAADMGMVYGNVRDANGEDFEIDLEAGTTYYIWTNIMDGTSHHIQDTTLTLFDADGTTVLAQNDDGPAGAVNSYIEYTPTAAIASATILVAPKTRDDRGTFQLQVSVTQPDLPPCDTSQCDTSC